MIFFGRCFQRMHAWTACKIFLYDSVVGPRTWNDLPDDVTSAESLSTFRRRLKTHLFAKSVF